MRKIFAASLSVLVLAGCLSLTEDPPEALLILSATAPLAPATEIGAPLSEAVSVATPALPPALQTLRLPVQATDTSIAYLKDARWAATPDRLFGTLLGEVIAVRTGRIVLDPLQLSGAAGLRLTGHLQSFGLDARTMEAVVVYDAAVTRRPGRVESRRFEARVPAAVAEPATVGAALNQAANQVAADVADWIGPAAGAR